MAAYRFRLHCRAAISEIVLKVLPIWGVNLPQEVDGLGAPYAGAVPGFEFVPSKSALCFTLNMRACPRPCPSL